MASISFQPRSQPPKGLTIVLVGGNRVGKSATGNTILMRKVFRSPLSSTAVTQLNGQNLAVVDTPGLFGRSSSEVMEEIRRCLSRASPGPVVFLVVMQPGRFTQDERRTVQIIQSTFSKETAHYTIALFTHGDELRTERRSVEELIGADPAMRDLIRECSRRYHVVDNTDTDPSQVFELLQKINNLVQINGEGGSTYEGRRGDAAGGYALGAIGGAVIGGAVIGGAAIGGAAIGGAAIGGAAIGGAVIGGAAIGGAAILTLIVLNKLV